MEKGSRKESGGCLAVAELEMRKEVLAAKAADHR
jgi:hypothetical protein